VSELRSLVDPTSEISITKQCELLGLACSTYYYEGATVRARYQEEIPYPPHSEKIMLDYK
jgi:hypothetical protein